MTIEVRRQTELQSRNWGVYRDGELIEGGFFNRLSAYEAAVEIRRDIRLESGFEFAKIPIKVIEL